MYIQNKSQIKISKSCFKTGYTQTIIHNEINQMLYLQPDASKVNYVPNECAKIRPHSRAVD